MLQKSFLQQIECCKKNTIVVRHELQPDAGEGSSVAHPCHRVAGDVRPPNGGERGEASLDLPIAPPSTSDRLPRHHPPHRLDVRH